MNLLDKSKNKVRNDNGNIVQGNAQNDNLGGEKIA